MDKYQHIAEKLAQLDLNEEASIAELDKLLKLENFAKFTEYVLALTEPEDIDSRLIEYIFKSDLSFESHNEKESGSSQLNVSPDINSLVNEFTSTQSLTIPDASIFSVRDVKFNVNHDISEEAFEVIKAQAISSVLRNQMSIDSEGNVVAANEVFEKKQSC